MVVLARTRVLHVAGTMLVLGVLVLGLSGCFLVEPSGNPESPSLSEPNTSVTETDANEDASAQLLPGAGAAENLPYFRQVLRQFSEGGEAVEGRPIVDALVAAGFDRATMQVSFDRSKTDLVADSILVSVLFEGECLLGQIVTEDRSTVATVAPALTEGQNLCLIGNTRPIDW
ncbi:DUF6993 domain-containing protein [Leucobacter sp. W1478]|uniref:DUF6993 domain-containing protein n=1 Tax=Leucobacter sp. W1478 TaxID=3439065 RepID=UPI003F2B7F7A